MGAANLGALVVAVGLAVAGGYDPQRKGDGPARPAREAIVAGEVEPVPMPDGNGFGIPDASGTLIPLRNYQRIVSTNMLADRLLRDLAEPDRIAGVGRISAANSPVRWQFAGKPTVDGMGPLEAIIALKPDLVLLNVYGPDGRIEKLRAAGIVVFNLGQLRGTKTVVTLANVVATLLGDPARGRVYGQHFADRMAHVAAGLGDRPRRRALYLTVMGNSIYGGTSGTSYHDVLTAAGLVDAAADKFVDWPQYRPEEIAALDPAVIVTKETLVEAACTHPGLAPLRVCRTPGAVIGLPDNVADDPGPGMLDAAELLLRRAYPEGTATTTPPRPPAAP